ncbi:MULTISPECIES: NADP-dependent oxidoreductase [Dyella]|uniref:NADP-dependent oxidoreductase n=2 Tax=Dyella TaxID=231454 RepID=A0A4R0YIL2_9GAMM|nr:MULTISPECIES: NADP-dependent oxidoreductase [Dyella]TBR36628.1 NADP-dependent oxidoreductase [Dyella terrae]TCI08280.1 NADP-dependent oxidoreductase [Dyella soli]
MAQRILLAARPKGEPTPADFRLEDVELAEPSQGQVLLRVLYLSLDPYMRGRMSTAKSYAKPVEIGEVMEGGTVAQVIASRDPAYQAGDIVLAYAGWQTHALASPKQIVRKLDPTQAPVSTALGVYGMPGFTAWSGLREIGKPKAGETLVVAAASGAVGSVVGQIAKLHGARAVGIAGGPDKCAYVRDELGFDVAIDHRAPDFAGQLKQACPDGIDVYFENVGGAVWDAVWPLLNTYARVPLCGLIASYNDDGSNKGENDRLPALMRSVLTRSITLRGFIQSEFVRSYPEFLKEMGGWLRDGSMRYREDIVEGLASAPDAFIGLLKGRNFGKLLVHLGDPD